MDYETTSSYSLTVSVTDGTNTDTETINISINDITINGPITLTGDITAASDGSTITLDLGANTHQSVTLGGNRTFAAPSNQVVGHNQELQVQNSFLKIHL